MRSTITFYGGAGTVTGANFCLDTGTQKLLIDCGANERENLCDPKNHEKFPYDAKVIDTLIITHAHQDHIGLVPKLMREGFKGVIYSTPETKELSDIMFQDALSVMEHDTERSGCPPIYDVKDVARALSAWRTHPYHTPFQLGDVTAEFLDAGHILGSAMVKLTRPAGGQTSGPEGGLTSTPAARSIIFTGDLGNSPEPLLRDVESPVGTDYLVMESVYGDRLHEGREDRSEILRAAIEGARRRDGTLLVPCFSLERTQIVLFELHRMIKEGKMEAIPVYLDAPLAQRVSEVYRRHIGSLNPEAQEAAKAGDIFSFPGLVEVVSPGESHHIHRKEGAKVIIAGAGMSIGGRIRAHEKAYLPDPNASILLTGYQAPGSLGRRIQDGARTVSIDGESVRVRARVSALTGYSGHADRDALLSFVAKAAEGGSPDASKGEAFREGAHETLEKAFVVMGEPSASQFLAQRIRDFLGVEAVVPKAGESAEISF